VHIWKLFFYNLDYAKIKKIFSFTHIGKDTLNIQIGNNFVSVQDMDKIFAPIVGFSGSVKSNMLSKF